MDRPVKYNFIPKKRDIETHNFVSLPELKYYQIALYRNKQNKYQIRKFIINSYNEIIDVKSAYFNKNKIEKFVERKRKNSFRVYPVYSLETVSYPSASDISLARSEILTTDHDYTGYSPYYCN